MIVLTGGAGFIGSNILAGLNATGRDEILVVDDLTDGRKYRNLIGSNYYDYMHYDDFLKQISHNVPFSQSIDVIIHQGACSVTTEWDGRYMMKNNYSYSKVLLHYCADHSIPFIYASSAAIYGANKDFQESAQEQEPLNIYGYSKWAFDQYVTRLLPDLKTKWLACVILMSMALARRAKAKWPRLPTILCSNCSQAAVLNYLVQVRGVMLVSIGVILYMWMIS